MLAKRLETEMGPDTRYMPQRYTAGIINILFDFDNDDDYSA